MRRQWLLALATILAGTLGLVAYYDLAPRRVPAGQRPLLAVERDGLEPLRAAFNAAAGHTRLIAFLSPT